MKKGLLALALSCVLLVPGATAFAAEVDDGRAEAVEAATNLLAAFQLEGCPFEEFGFEPFDMGDIVLGESLSNDLESFLVYWPVLSGGKVVACVTEAFDEDGFSTYSLVSPDACMDGLAGVRKMACASLGETDSISVEAITAKASSGTSVILPVKVVPQGRVGTCWAAVVSTIGRYLSSTYKDPVDIAIDIAGGTNKGGDAISVMRALYSYVYDGTGTRINSVWYTGGVSDGIIRSFLDSKMPIFAGMTAANLDPHAVTIYGYAVLSSGTMTVSYLNSGDLTSGIMTRGGSGAYTLGYAGAAYRWNGDSIAPVEWQRIGNASWYYIYTDGTQAIGWAKISGNWYYFSEYGRMFWDEWISYNGSWYYVKPSGIMASNEWIIPDGTWWYHVDASGAMQTGWYSDGSNWYYLRPATNTPASGPQGAMLANGSWYIGGKTYHFNSSGVCTNP